MDVKRYTQQTHPVNLLTLINGGVLKHLLNGFCYALKTGVSVLFSNDRKIGINTIERRDPLSDPALARDFLHPFCGSFRSNKVLNEKCERFDKQIALEDYHRSRRTPRLAAAEKVGRNELHVNQLRLCLCSYPVNTLI